MRMGPHYPPDQIWAPLRAQRLKSLCGGLSLVPLFQEVRIAGPVGADTN